MADFYDYLADVMTVVRQDPKLRECFVRVLGAGRETELRAELEDLGAPEVVMKFVRLLTNEELAQIVLTILKD